MMSQSDPHRSMFYNLSLGSFVASEHPLRGCGRLLRRQAFARAPFVFRLNQAEESQPP
jgi:hypothetical protein